MRAIPPALGASPRRRARARSARPARRRRARRRASPARDLSAAAASEMLVDQLLARGAEQDRHAEPVIKRQAGHHGDVVVQVLAEADAGIGDELGPGNARRHAGSDPLFQEVEHVEHHIAVLRIVVHGLGVALGVHQDHRQPRLGRNAQRSRIMCQRRDIVEDIGARRRGAAHHLGLARIDRRSARGCAGAGPRSPG